MVGVCRPGGVLLTTIDPNLLTAPNIVESLMGRERAGVAELREAAVKLDEIIRERVVSDLRALGRTHEEIDHFLAGAPRPSEPAKRQRAPQEKPDAPPHDAPLCDALLLSIGDGRATSKGNAPGERAPGEARAKTGARGSGW